MFPQGISAHLPSRSGQGSPWSSFLVECTVSLAAASSSLAFWALPGPSSWGRISLLIICQKD